MAVYLFSWDPTKWDWRNIKEQSEQVARGDVPVIRQWSCGTNRRIFKGDIAYFLRQGREPRGVFARGEIVRGSYEAANVDVQDANPGRNTLVVDIRFMDLEDAVNQVVIPRPALSTLGKFVWDIRESGALVPDAAADALEKAWDKQRGRRAPQEAPVPTRAVSAKNAPVPAPPASPPISTDEASADEQSRLKLEREEKLEKIKAREQAERLARAAAERAARSTGPSALSLEQRNEVLVQNYFIMLDAELQGELYSKADHRNRILKELGESDAAKVDEAHRHISGILAEIGLPFADGFAPQGGFDQALEEAVQLFIESNPDLIEALWLEKLPPPASIPVELDDSKAHWTAAPAPGSFRPSARPAWHPVGVNEIDYRVREARNRNLAMAGERFVLAFERARLREAGMKDQLEKIVWQSQTFGDSFGYDILSLNEDGSERHICVKTTNYGSRFPFVLGHRELERARANPKRFHVYRVFNFSKGARLFILTAEQVLKNYLEAVVYRTWI